MQRVSESEVEYKLLYKLTKQQIDDIYDIVGNPTIMKYAGSGPWTRKKLDDLVKYSKEDHDNNFSKSRYYYAGMLINNKIIALCGLHPMPFNKPGIQMSGFIHPNYQKKGYSKYLIKYMTHIAKTYFNDQSLYKVTLVGHPNINHKTYKYDRIDMIKGVKYYVVKIYDPFDKPTFLILASDKIIKNCIDYNYFIKLLTNKNMQQISIDNINKNIDFVWFNNINQYNKYNKQINNINIKLKNEYINNDDKDLVKLFKQQRATKFIPRVWDITALTCLPNKTKIYTINSSTLDNDIKLITTNDELHQYQKSIQSRQNSVLQEYYTNRVLFKNKQCHFKLYILIKLFNNELSYSVFNTLSVYTARDNYIHKEYLNNNIHNTNEGDIDYKYLNTEINISEENKKNISKQISELSSIIFNIIKNKNMQIYNDRFNNKNIFEIYSIDFIMLNNKGKYKIILIDFNNNNDYKIVSRKKSQKFQIEFYEWIYENTIKEIFNI